MFIKPPQCFLCDDTTNNVRYCSLCGKYFCDNCRRKYGARLKAATDEKLSKLKKIFM